MNVINEDVEYDNYEDMPNTSQLNNLGSNSSLYTPLINRNDCLNFKTPQAIQDELENGTDLYDIVNDYPKSTIKAIRDLSIRKIGTFEISDTIALNAFGQDALITRGSETMDDENYEENWKRILEKEAKNRISKSDYGWKSLVTICVYAICVKNAANIKKKGLLNPILLKAKAATMTYELFQIPALQAIVDYKWRTYARKIIFIEFMIYLIWVLSFIIFVVLFVKLDDSLVGKHVDEDSENIASEELVAIYNASIRYKWGQRCLLVSFLSMIPFMILELNTIIVYRRDWITMSNIFDLINIYNQAMITTLYVLNYGLGKSFYSILLSLHSIILFTKIQYFARCFSRGSSFVEVLCLVIWRVRWFLIFILFSIFSATFMFMNLYRLEDKNEYIFENFDGFFNTFVTMFGFLIGGFKYDSFLESKLSLLTATAFIWFQVYMAITILNLLIGVMTESYIKITQNDFVLFTSGRAEVIDELEVSLPSCCLLNCSKIDNYVHFAIIKQNKAAKDYDTIGDDDLENNVQKTKVDMMIGIDKDIALINEQINALSKQILGLSRDLSNKYQ